MNKVMLLVIDGWGYRPEREGNAILQATTPVWDGLLRDYPQTTILASGKAVGLRPGLMGNSEVGHMTLGAGRVIWQDITRIDNAIDTGTFEKNPVLLEAVKGSKALNLLGLVSNGGVHSDEKHYFALIDFARKQGLPVKFHVMMDGRDTPPKSGVDHVQRLVDRLQGAGHVATLMGRYYGMDRDKRWDRTERAWNALTAGEGRGATDPVEAVREAYELGETDEFIQPYVFPGEGMADGETLMCFDFRADRMRQITMAFQFDEFEGFVRKVRPKVRYCSMTRYQEDWEYPVLYPRESHPMILGELFAGEGVPQLRIAETEKYAHVTFFFNAGVDELFKKEKRILVASPKVPTYDKKPEMSAREITKKVVEAIESDRFGFIVMNYANPDMVGHSGEMKPTVEACEVVDECLGRVIEATRKHGWTLFITGDHGNAEQMIDPVTGGRHTYHTTNPVPLVMVNDERKGMKLSDGGAFKDVAPTILEVAGIKPPGLMEGRSLLSP